MKNTKNVRRALYRRLNQSLPHPKSAKCCESAKRMHARWQLDEDEELPSAEAIISDSLMRYLFINIFE